VDMTSYGDVTSSAHLVTMTTIHQRCTGAGVSEWLWPMGRRS